MNFKILTLCMALCHNAISEVVSFITYQEGGGDPPEGSLSQAIKANFGSLNQLIEKINAEGAALQGSGWVVSPALTPFSVDSSFSQIQEWLFLPNIFKYWLHFRSIIFVLCSGLRLIEN